MKQVKSIMDTVIINNPSPKLLKLVRALSEKQATTRREMLNERDKYFPLR